MDVRDEIGVEGMTEEDVERALIEALHASVDLAENLRSVVTFEQAGLLTHDRGVVVRLTDGSAFQLSIVRSQ